jgi:phosphate acyltransferase
LARSAHELLAGSGLNFVGNIEGRDILKNSADVVVTDGFTGNVALKLLEGCATALFTRIKAAARSSTRAKIGGLLLKPSLRGMRSALDPEEVGGAALLGVRGLVVICHGNSSRKAIANALLFGAEALRKGILPGVVAELERAGVKPGATPAGSQD